MKNARIIGQGVIRGGRLAIGLVALLLVCVQGAPAAEGAPQLGRWEGVSPNQLQVSFQVMQAKGESRRAATYLTLRCPLRGDWNLHAAAKSRDAVIVKPGDTRRPYTYPITRVGRLQSAIKGGIVSPAITGRLKRDSATIRVDHGLVCDGHEFGQPVKVQVKAVPGPPSPRAGVWVIDSPPPSRLRFEVFGTGVQYFNGHLLKGVGTYQGVPYPCAGLLVDTLPTWLPADGSFLVDRPDPPLHFEGRFESETTLSGSYLVHPAPAEVTLFRCAPVPYPFEAHLEKAAPPPRLEGDPLVEPIDPPQPTLPDPTEPTDYVALGDSYSSGEGVKPFDPETATRGNRCHRSAHAYSRVFAPPGYQLNRTFLACSGAITANVGRLDGSGALVGTPQSHDDSGVVQLARLAPATWEATDLVTVTVGGNDAKFASVLKQCVLLPCHKGKRAERIKERIATELPALLSSTYAAIRRTAPNAGVVTLGYPQLFPSDPRDRCPIGKRVVSRAKQIFLRERGEQLNAIVRTQALAAGFHFVDAERAFSGHEPCGKRDEWIHALVLPLRIGPNRGEVIFSFHPNQKGQRAYAGALRGYLGCLYGHDFPFLPTGVPAGVSAAQPVPNDCL